MRFRTAFQAASASCGPLAAAAAGAALSPLGPPHAGYATRPGSGNRTPAITQAWSAAMRAASCSTHEPLGDRPGSQPTSAGLERRNARKPAEGGESACPSSHPCACIGLDRPALP